MMMVGGTMNRYRSSAYVILNLARVRGIQVAIAHIIRGEIGKWKSELVFNCCAVLNRKYSGVCLENMHAM